MSTEPSTSAAERYAELTFDRMQSAVPRGLPAEPPPWVRVPRATEWVRRLPPVARSPLVDWTPSPAEARDPGAGATLDLPALTALLSLGAGVSCVEFGPQSSWRHHRMAPSARCVFPCSVWVVGQGDDADEPDIARYHPEHQHLRSRTPFKHSRWTRIRCAVSAAPGTTGAHYGDYAYRLVCQEAGLLTGALLLAARSLGVRAAPDLAHHPYAIEQLLSLDGQHECAFTLIELTGAVTEVIFRAPDLPAPAVRRPCAALGELGALSSAAHRAFAGAPPRRTPAAGTSTESSEPDCTSPSPPRVPWQRLRAARDSGDPGFVPAPRPIDAGTLHRLCIVALTTAFPGLWHGLPQPTLLVARREVTGAELGLFRHDQPDHRLLPRTSLNSFLRRCQMVASTNAHQAPATVFVVADLDDWLRHDAARAYTELHLRTGEAALRLLMAASAEGLVARVHNGFLTEPVRDVCGPGRWVAPFAVLLSERRPSARYRFVLEGGM
ncbi:nitroreductase family protein [Streptomyces sp. NPDC051218]|uniref:nitroreductase family protein n=1 Tax=Streptomyces sp. NPDC051218 TaxID=3365645 RepID=UPI00379149AA